MPIVNISLQIGVSWGSSRDGGQRLPHPPDTLPPQPPWPYVLMSLEPQTSPLSSKVLPGDRAAALARRGQHSQQQHPAISFKPGSAQRVKLVLAYLCAFTCWRQSVLRFIH